MGVEFRWDDDAKTLLRYVALGAWNWTDFHRAVRVATFALYNAGETVDVVFDLRGGHRLPAGAVGHLRTVGKKVHPRLSGRAAIIGLDAETRRQLAPDGSPLLALGDQRIYFAEDDAHALALLRP